MTCSPPDRVFDSLRKLSDDESQSMSVSVRNRAERLSPSRAAYPADEMKREDGVAASGAEEKESAGVDRASEVGNGGNEVREEAEEENESKGGELAKKIDAEGSEKGETKQEGSEKVEGSENAQAADKGAEAPDRADNVDPTEDQPKARPSSDGGDLRADASRNSEPKSRRSEKSESKLKASDRGEPKSDASRKSELKLDDGEGKSHRSETGGKFNVYRSILVSTEWLVKFPLSFHHAEVAFCCHTDGS